MAFSTYNAQFTRVGPPNDNCPTIWTYIAAETTLDAVAVSGYFNAIAGKLKVGDLIYFTTASSPWLAGLAVVKSNTRNLTAVPPVMGVVDLFNFTVVNTSINSG
ncbi:MAG: hypothetical protein ACRETL_00935 [Gammaproteobacteria bacterium]